MGNKSGKLSIWLVIAIVLLCAIGTGGYLIKTQRSGTAAEKIDDPVKWYAYAEGLKLGKDTGKKVYLFFKAEWCTYCTKMEKETFQDPAIISLVGARHPKELCPGRETREQCETVYVHHFGWGCLAPTKDRTRFDKNLALNIISVRSTLKALFFWQ